MWELDHKEGWALKNWCFWIVELWKTLRLLSLLDSKDIKPVNPKENQSWILIGRTDAEAETPTLWPPDAKNWLIGKDPMLGKMKAGGEGDNRGGMVGWHHWLDGHEFEQASGVGDGQGGLVCCSPRGHKESDRTKRLNWKLNFTLHSHSAPHRKLNVSHHVNSATCAYHRHLCSYYIGLRTKFLIMENWFPLMGILHCCLSEL